MMFSLSNQPQCAVHCPMKMQKQKTLSDCRAVQSHVSCDISMFCCDKYPAAEQHLFFSLPVTLQSNTRARHSVLSLHPASVCCALPKLEKETKPNS